MWLHTTRDWILAVATAIVLVVGAGELRTYLYSRQHPVAVAEQPLDPAASLQATSLEHGTDGSAPEPLTGFMLVLLAAGLGTPVLAAIVLVAMAIEDRYDIALVGPWDGDNDDRRWSPIYWILIAIPLLTAVAALMSGSIGVALASVIGLCLLVVFLVTGRDGAGSD